MRIRDHLTYANVMATIAVFGVVAGGGAYAASKIDTPDIANKAVTAKKLDRRAVKTSRISPGAVKTPKLRSAAVTSDKLADGAVETRNLSEFAPVPMAGVVVYDNAIRGWFNRLSDQPPTLERTQTGVYELFIPGINADQVSLGNLLGSVSLLGSAGEIATGWKVCTGGGCLYPIISTFDSSGNPEDRAFTYVLNRADHALP